MLPKCLLHMLEAINHLSSKPVQSDHPPGKEMFPYVQSEPPLVPL